MWDIKKIVKKGEYLYAVVPKHPNATKHGYVLEHRIIMENHLQRLLKDNEIVHHKDHNKHNNNIENLELLTNSEHSKLHAKHGRTILSFICPNCGIKFNREKRNAHPNTTPKCSRKCNGEYSRKIQLNRI